MRARRRHSEYGGTYLGFNIRLTPDVEHCQALLCERFSLEEAEQLHVTVGYLGRIARPVVPRLVEYMRGLKHILPSAIALDVEGISACAHLHDVVMAPFGDADFEQFADRPRAA